MQIIVSLILLFSLTSHATVIREIDLANQRIAIEISDRSLRSGEILILDQLGGRQCQFLLTEIKNEIGLALIGECAFENEIRVGLELRKSLFSDFDEFQADGQLVVIQKPASASTVTTELRNTDTATGARAPRRGWAFTALYSSADNMKAKGNLSAESNGIILDFDFNETLATNPVMGFGMAYHRLRSYGWGYICGGTYEFKREFQNSFVFAPFDNEDNPRPYLYLFTLLANATLNLNELFFLYAGPNFALPFFGNHEGRMDISGKLGFQAGFGFDLNEHLQLELGYRLVRSTFEGSVAGENVDASFDSENRISGFNGNLKFFF